MNPKNIEDIQLITKVINGCRKSEELLYNKYRKIITNFIIRSYPNDHDVEDDASDVLMKIIENLRSYDPNSAQFNTWVLCIAKNHMIDKFKKIKPIYTTFNYYEDQNTTIQNNSNNCIVWSTIPVYELTNYCSTTDFEIKDSLSYISSQMENGDYHMLKMKYSDGYNYNEISKEFNITSSTVSNKVNYVKSKMKKIESM